MIPPEENGDFVAAMEAVFDVYRRPYNPDNPVICLDECPKQLIGEKRIPIAMTKGVALWTASRNSQRKAIDWQFNTDQARIKLKHLYPKENA